MSERVEIRMRVCSRCGHEECPCCRDFCDNIECIAADDDVPNLCTDGECVYDGVMDVAGYARLDAAMARAGELPYIQSVEGGLLVLTDEEAHSVEP